MINSEFIHPYKIILGSGSPRRSSILADACIPFIKRVISIDENYPFDYPIKDVPVYLALEKAKAHKNTIVANEIVLTADSIVILENKILGKPKDIDEAKNILSQLSGKSHLVVTGVCFMTKSTFSTFSSESEVEFAHLSSSEIDFYVDNYGPLDKAGAYGIQDWIGYNKVVSIKGSYLNIMGLPMELVYHELQKFINKIK
jgi:septum formation protein